MQPVSEHDLNELGEEFSARLRRGERPSMSEFTNRFAPESAEEIEEFLESIAMLEGMKQKESPAPKRSEAFPRDFGRYQIESSLGEGGMGTVYLAHDSQLDRKVALKTPKFDQNSDPNLMTRFHREAKSAATLRHPNICPVYDVGQIDGIHYISMAYIEGRPLSDYIHSGKVPSVSSVIRIVRKVALALHEAHTNGLIHRDLKPANIMIDGRNEPIVMDFGLARQFGDASISSPSMPVLGGSQDSEQRKGFEPRLTQEGTVVGSPGYMSPEQLMGDHVKIGPASDVYALGAMFYELLTGRLPFPGDGSLVSIVNAVLSDDPPDASTVRSAVDSRTGDVCRKAMAKKTKDRFQSMQTFAVALTGLLKSKDGVSKEQGSDDLSLKTISSDLVRTKEQYELSKSLYQEGQYAAAASIMEKMVDTAGSPNQFTTWAGKQLPKAKAKARDTGSRNIASAANELGDDFWNADFEGNRTDTATQTATRSQKRKRNRKQPLQHKAAIAAACLVAVVLIGIAINQFSGPPAKPLPENQTALVPSDTEKNQPDQQPLKDDADSSTDEPNDNQQGRRSGTARQSIIERIWRLDTNGDDKLSKAELGNTRPLQGGPVGQLVTQFETFDTAPKDGLLDSREIQRLLRALPRPGNRDGLGRDGDNRAGDNRTGPGRDPGPRRRPGL